MSSPAKPTRQQLDELDALLQRMLSLPVSQIEAELPAPPPPAVEPRPAMVMPPAPRPPMPAPPPPRRAAPPTGDHAWQVPLPANAGGASFAGWPVGIEALSASATSSVRPQPAPAPVPIGRLNVTTIPSPDEANRAREAPPAMARPRPDPAAAVPTVALQLPLPLPVAAPEPPLPFYLWPMATVDRSLGGTLAAFGLPGRWLGQGSGKILFGWAGLLMLAAAAVWGVMDYLGWSW